MKTGKPNNDHELIAGLKSDDHDSFKLLFGLYSKPLFQFSVKYLKSSEAAEDIVQEVFSKIWKNRKELKTDTSFKSYIFTIALNSIRKQFNKRSRLNQAKHDILFDFSQSKSEFDERENYQSLLDKLDELINQMPEKRKQVFVKKKLEEKPIKEIALELEITSKTVEYHITEAMKFLKTEFGKLQIKGMIFFCLFVKRSC